MPAPTALPAQDRADPRSRLLAAQFWVGIALAPFAALLLIFGGTTAAAVLAIIAVVVLALSVLMRHEPSTGPAESNAALVEEISALRDDVRADITTAARATHRALSEKVTRLQESLAGMQREVDAARAVAIEARDAADNRRELPLPPPRRPVAAGSAPAVVRHTQTVVTSSMYVDEPSHGYESRTYGSGRSGDSDGSGHGPPHTYGSARVSANARPLPERTQAPDHDADERGASDPGAYRPGADGRGVSEHGVNEGEAEKRDHRPDGPRDRRGRGRPEARAPHELTAEREETWTEQGLRTYTSRRDDPAGWRDDPARGSGRHAGRDRGDSGGEVADDPRWSDMRDGDRWAEVRTDDRGRELRMAERREERRVDETGTQLRIVDRWSSVREERIPDELEERVHSNATYGRLEADHRAPVPHAPSLDEDRWAGAGRLAAAGDAWAPRFDGGSVDGGGQSGGSHAGGRSERDRVEPGLPRPRRPLDDVDVDGWHSGSGWRDVRSGVIEPDHSDRPREPAALPGRFDTSSPLDPPQRAARGDGGVVNRDGPGHDDVGIYRRRDDRTYVRREYDEREHDEREHDEREDDEPRASERRYDERPHDEPRASERQRDDSRLAQRSSPGGSEAVAEDRRGSTWADRSGDVRAGRADVERHGSHSHARHGSQPYVRHGSQRPASRDDRDHRDDRWN